MRTIVLTRRSSKQLDKLNKELADRIIIAIKKLKRIPAEADIETIKGEKNKMRLRVGNYRVLFKLENDNIIISDIGPRGDIYK